MLRKMVFWSISVMLLLYFGVEAAKKEDNQLDSFTRDEINRFDRIQTCLEDPKCRTAFGKYILNKQPSYIKILGLWEEANNANHWDEVEMRELIDNVDDFDQSIIDKLAVITNDKEKLNYIKEECCIILERIRNSFIDYLLHEIKISSTH